MTEHPRPRIWLRVIGALAIIFMIVLLVLLHSTEWLVQLGGRVTGERLARAQRSPQYRDGRFRNVEKRTTPDTPLRETLRRSFFGEEQRSPLRAVPVVSRTGNDFATAPASGLRATWIGWSSVFVEIDGATVLTDPIWSERCSPSTLVGPRRFHAPPISLESLPHVDVVVISHDHYDHLDMPAIRTLAARGTRFAVPLGVGAHLERWGVPPSQIHDLDWNESVNVKELTVIATPARHYSGRNPRYANAMLWASWVVRGPKNRIFFSGDSGYTARFAEIGRQHGPFDLTLIKIGASDPSWVDIHMSPEQAIRTHLDVGGKRMLPVHWATFNLGFHNWGDPPDQALAAATEVGASVIFARPGEMFEPATAPAAVQTWWRDVMKR